MTSNQQAGPGNSSDPNSGPSPRARLSKRWTAWATNLLASGIILIAGVTFGRQAIQWMSADPLGTGDLSKPVVGRAQPNFEHLTHALQFGDSDLEASCERLSGPAEDVVKRLHVRTREIVRSTDPLDELPGPGVARWLKKVSQEDLVESEPGKWQIYAQQMPLPVVIGVRIAASPGTPARDLQVAVGRRRVVCWSLAFPKGPVADNGTTQWSLFTFVRGRETPNADRLGIALPEGFQRTMSVGSGESSLIGFRGGGTPRDVMEHFDAVAVKQDWQRRGSWQSGQQNWRCCFTTREEQTLHVTFSQDGDLVINGMIMFVRPKETHAGEKTQ